MLQNLKSQFLILLKFILVLFLSYQSTRILFYLFNQESFQGFDASIFLGGIRFDLSAIAFLNMFLVFLFLLPIRSKIYFKILKWLFLMVNSLFLCTNLVDVAYYKFTLKRSTFSLITAEGMREEMKTMIFSFVRQFWYLFLIGIALIWVLYKSLRIQKLRLQPQNWKGIILQIFLALVTTAGFLILAKP